jgi:hypothetical protein
MEFKALNRAVRVSMIGYSLPHQQDRTFCAWTLTAIPTVTSNDYTNCPISSRFHLVRLQSLDAYRGLIMIALAFNGFGLAATADKFLVDNPNSVFWKNVRYQFSHVEWRGCAFDNRSTRLMITLGIQVMMVLIDMNV